MRNSRFLLLILGVVAAALGCQPAENAVLIDVHTQADIETLRVTVLSLDTARRWEEPVRRVDRTAEDVNAEPLRVAVILGAPEYVLVHLQGTTPDGEVIIATRCYAVHGVLLDEVTLFGPLADLDLDGDGFAADAASTCREPGEDGSSTQSCDADPYVCPDDRAADCDAADASIHPGAPTICLDGVDQDCDGMDEPCGDQDGDGVDACPLDPVGPCDCNDNVSSINPRAEDICVDGIDQDCDGMDACCDADGDGSPACGAAGPDCDDSDPNIQPGATEVCDGLDNNCNGQTDELDECRGPDLDGDGVAACGREEPGEPCDCNDCDRAIHANALELCGPRVDPGLPGNGVDEDCDGMVDEGCPADDLDGDGVSPPRDCNDADPLVFPPLAGREPVDRCGDTIANNCIPGEDAPCTADTDGDMWAEPAACEASAAINPQVMETCNGVDDDCDGVQDEVLSVANDIGCVSGTQVLYATDFTNCGGCRNLCNTQTSNACVGGSCSCEWNAAGGGAECAATDTCCPTIGCVNLQDDELNCGVCGNACGTGEECVAGICTCGATSGATGEDACPESAGGLEANLCCSGQCRDVSNDNSNCGQCGLACGPHSMCSDRLCECVSPAGERWEDCNGDRGLVGNNGCEINTLGSDTSHCGSCTTVCMGGQATWACNSGTCEPTGCVGNFSNCDTVASNGCEADLTRNASCGACAPAGACGPAESCDASFRCTCGPSTGTARGGRVCTASQTCCATTGGCVNTANDTANCGGCNVRCGAAEGCSGGACTCPGTTGGVGAGEACRAPSDTCCAGIGCVDLGSNASHCGMCGRGCALGERCSSSTCGPVCGNNIVTTGEPCDDGDTTSGDGCSNTCAVEAGWSCSGNPSICTPICGDGMRRGSEGCDDGDTTGGDGCSATCTVEIGWTCGATCTPICGDGMRLGGEACDDSNTAGGDGCSSTCTVESGWVCTGAGPGSCTAASCGDGLRRGTEACDDGDNSGGDGCSPTCTVESGWTCTSGSPSACTPTCGDGMRVGGEACDDGDGSSGDGCSSTCNIESGWVCMGTPSTCAAAACGDGIRAGAEACDDGFTTACGPCNATCTAPGSGSCGDGVVCSDNETCDDNNTSPCGTCNASCTGAGSGATCGTGVECSVDGDCMNGNCTGSDVCN